MPERVFWLYKCEDDKSAPDTSNRTVRGRCHHSYRYTTLLLLTMPTAQYKGVSDNIACNMCYNHGPNTCVDRRFSPVVKCGSAELSAIQEEKKTRYGVVYQAYVRVYIFLPVGGPEPDDFLL